MLFRKLRLLLLVVVIDAFQEAEAAVTSCCDRCFFRKLRLLLLVVVIDVFQEAEAAVTSCDRCFSGS